MKQLRDQLRKRLDLDKVTQAELCRRTEIQPWVLSLWLGGRRDRLSVNAWDLTGRSVRDWLEGRHGGVACDAGRQHPAKAISASRVDSKISRVDNQWSENEDKMLARLVEREGPGNWPQKARSLDSGRSAAAVEQHYRAILKKRTKAGSQNYIKQGKVEGGLWNPMHAAMARLKLADDQVALADKGLVLKLTRQDLARDELPVDLLRVALCKDHPAIEESTPTEEEPGFARSSYPQIEHAVTVSAVCCWQLVEFHATLTARSAIAEQNMAADVAAEPPSPDKSVTQAADQPQGRACACSAPNQCRTQSFLGGWRSIAHKLALRCDDVVVIEIEGPQQLRLRTYRTAVEARARDKPPLGAFVAVEFVNGEFNGKVVKDGAGEQMWVRFHGHSKPLLVHAGQQPVRLLDLEQNEGLGELWERGAAAVNDMLQHATTSDRLQGRTVKKQFDSGLFDGTVMKKTKYESLDCEHEEDWFLVRYNDGDQEELARHEVVRYLVQREPAGGSEQQVISAGNSGASDSSEESSDDSEQQPQRQQPTDHSRRRSCMTDETPLHVLQAEQAVASSAEAAASLKVLRRSYLVQGHIQLSPAFSRHITATAKSVELSIEVQNTGTWKMRAKRPSLKGKGAANYVILHQGWRQFVDDSGSREGDAVVFELLEPGLLRARIFAGPAVKDTGRHEEKESESGVVELGNPKPSTASTLLLSTAAVTETECKETAMDVGNRVQSRQQSETSSQERSNDATVESIDAPVAGCKRDFSGVFPPQRSCGFADANVAHSPTPVMREDNNSTVITKSERPSTDEPAMGRSDTITAWNSPAALLAELPDLGKTGADLQAGESMLLTPATSPGSPPAADDCRVRKRLLSVMQSRYLSQAEVCRGAGVKPWGLSLWLRGQQQHAGKKMWELVTHKILRWLTFHEQDRESTATGDDVSSGHSTGDLRAIVPVLLDSTRGVDGTGADHICMAEEKMDELLQPHGQSGRQGPVCLKVVRPSYLSAGLLHLPADFSQELLGSTYTAEVNVYVPHGNMSDHAAGPVDSKVWPMKAMWEQRRAASQSHGTAILTVGWKPFTRALDLRVDDVLVLQCTAARSVSIYIFRASQQLKLTLPNRAKRAVASRETEVHGRRRSPTHKQPCASATATTRTLNAWGELVSAPILADISCGREKRRIPVANVIDDTPPPNDFEYIQRCLWPDDMELHLTLLHSIRSCWRFAAPKHSWRVQCTFENRAASDRLSLELLVAQMLHMHVDAVEIEFLKCHVERGAGTHLLIFLEGSLSAGEVRRGLMRKVNRDGPLPALEIQSIGSSVVLQSTELAIGRSFYSDNGLLIRRWSSGVVECNSRCSCGTECPNRCASTTVAIRSRSRCFSRCLHDCGHAQRLAWSDIVLFYPGLCSVASLKHCKWSTRLPKAGVCRGTLTTPYNPPSTSPNSPLIAPNPR